MYLYINTTHAGAEQRVPAPLQTLLLSEGRGQWETALELLMLHLCFLSKCTRTQNITIENISMGKKKGWKAQSNTCVFQPAVVHNDSAVT